MISNPPPGYLGKASRPFGIQEILDYPPVGPSYTQWRDGTTASSTTGATVGPHLLKLDAGTSGVVREVTFIMSLGGSWTLADIINMHIKVFADCGTLTGADLTTPPADYLVADIPLSAVFGTYFIPGTSYTDLTGRGGSGSTSAANYVQCKVGKIDAHLTMDNGGYESTDAIAVTIKYPMPFSNGIYIQLGQYYGVAQEWTPLDGTTGAYTFVTYDLGALPVGRLGQYRFRTSSWSGVIDSTHNATFITKASGYGCAAAVYCSLQAENVNEASLMLEANWSFKTNGGSTYNWQSSGGEDIFGTRGVYFFQAGAFIDGDGTGGCFYKLTHGEAAKMTIEGARSFHETPIQWSSGVTGMLPWYNGGASPSNVGDGHVTFVYYSTV